ncbi:CoA ester lyase [Halorubrum ezzemoulense]|jgi:citrate lyase subunit beta/citryl-CoA lyase|uniref:Citrate lyase subunit beta / citryl-CoA lyase n=3 Tax=Halorubrum TaxID=56688 RepID=A0A256JU87_HALEZ|nr:MULTISPECIES: CoA ester lyase [Halorubrum]MDB2224481.1 CoA ester lyase [Halorubrum ezzemoulense]MDB2242443.1 CoA ester lyase [Halorubrum ezzemoulense]MDB2245785.1 CoA ester lyase [Halorubrum ezzemoulense]MDB2252949.1 CoA ester lyase [Halorubrum ezzemoulense]MDB2264775.1 CoA ester lyase [Halorubrum ezzemoulense]
MTDVTLRRTQLATPASDEKMMHSAADSDADEVFLDLEDSVAPNAKPDAREPLIEAAREEDWSDKVLSFRMNGIDTEWWYDDVITVVGAAGESIDDIIIPKVKSASDIHTVENLLRQVEVNNGLEVGAIGLEPQIEDGEGIHNVHDIAHASDRLSSIIFGPGDYSAAMGTPGLDIGQFPEYPGHYWHHALSECNSAAKSAGLPCLDGPYADIEDADGFRQSAERANMIGCDGKWAIHPSQIEIGNDVFAPDPETAERAKRIVDAYAEAMEEGKGAVSVDGQMVDEATNKMAQDIVETAEAAGIL